MSLACTSCGQARYLMLMGDQLRCTKCSITVLSYADTATREDEGWDSGVLANLMGPPDLVCPKCKEPSPQPVKIYKASRHIRYCNKCARHSYAAEWTVAPIV